MDHNEFYLKKGKNITDFLTWKLIFPILLIIYIIASPISVLIISLVISILIFRPKFKSKSSWKNLLISFLLLHFCLTSICSISPYLQFKNFQVTHWKWKETNGNIENESTKWEEITRQKEPKAIANIQYSFNYKNQLKKQTEFDAIKIVYPWFFGKTETKKEELQRQLSQNIQNYIKNKEFKILVNPKNGESKLFITTEKILLSNSGFYSLLMSIMQIFLGIAILIGVVWFIYKIFPNKIRKN